MKIILDIATILGGIAALWFFWNEISALRVRQPPTEASTTQPAKTQRQRVPTSSNHRISIFSRDAWGRKENSGALSIIGAITGMIFGGLGWLVGVKYGLIGVVASFVVFLIAVAIDVSFANDDKEHPLVHALLIGVASSVLTAIVSAISSVFFSVTDSTVGIIIGVVIGIAYGFRYGDGDPLKFSF
jgi:hypothetical protein